ncbi:protein of unknown function (DUF955) [Bernardetia litoralis DSM 6794]|uniref:HTH cro/C1-type domain-containing protein n=1 Tax=Bernardetia litoralis (strain ATCC 23117 / DSM 6794 / NBRC 15988 / NCIMB 1366 / Fx l1 / Sio-4) TaxID=880071 RepID=I4AKL1_BERLS|nr:helix-turn-helix transcriptional regulator [Bernardetia litoralis]AFM04496.1 protein of unknown function (DUF955) [Bernardetia litoralis DSM 6794]
MNDRKSFIRELYSYLNDDPPTLKELYELKIGELGLSQSQVENILNIDKKTLQSILNQDAKRVDFTNLIKLGAFLGLGFDETLKLFTASMAVEQISDIEKSRRAIFIAENFDVKALKKMKFLKSVNDFEHIEEKIKTFFQLDSIYDYEKDVGTAFSRTKRTYNNKMLDFWVKSAYSYLQEVDNPNEYNRNNLKELIPKIKSYSRDTENGLKIVVKALYAIGITVIFQPYITGTQIRGATFFINKKTPCIVITDLNKKYATLWFALLHELYHVLFELDKVEQNVFHLTGEPNLFLMEEEQADDFARQYFLSYDKSNYIFPLIDDHFAVEQYAKQNKIHSSLIYNFFCYDMQQQGKNHYWAIYNSYLTKPENTLKGININVWNNENINEKIAETKKSFII